MACFSSLMYRYTSGLIVIYLNIWIEHLQSCLSSRKVLSSQTIFFFIKFEIFLIKGIVIWKFGADKLFEFSFRKKKPSKIDLIIMSDIPFRNKQTQLKEHFKFYIHCLLKSCLVLRSHQFWIHRYRDNYTDSNFTCKSSEVRNLS